MQTLKLQLNTPPRITQDIQVELINEVTQQVVRTTPYLDGMVNVRNLPPAAYRLKVRHPNLVFDIYDQRIRVLPDRPTFVPVRIPLDIFEDTPVRDVAEADLGPSRDKLATSAEAAERQGRKRPGQPIFADDWNELSGVVADIARAGVDLAAAISPTGHDHPELIEKLDEIQGNLQRFLDVFGKSLTQLQRQIEQVALQQRAEEALDNIPNVSAGARGLVRDTLRELATARDDSPYLYTSARKRVGETLATQLAELLPDDPDVRQIEAVDEYTKVTTLMAEASPVHTFESEVRNYGKVDREVANASFAKVVGRGIG